METDNTYNGWTNYETWLWKLWIDNDQGSYEYWREQTQGILDDGDLAPEYDWETLRDVQVAALAEQLESDADEGAEMLTGVTGPFADLLTGALGRIDWREIAGSMIDAED